MKPHPARTATQRFERHECKYVISESKARAVYRYVEPYLIPDPYAAKQPDHTYSISSLYVDSPTLSLCQQTLNGDPARYKLRVRCYGEGPDEPVFLEIKRRRNRIIQKLRCRINRRDLATVLHRGSPQDSSLNDKDRATIAEFQDKVSSIDGRPIVLVAYRRQAYMGDGDAESRVTFDRNVRSLATDQPEVWLPNRTWDIAESTNVVLELKFNSRPPRWMSDVARHCGLSLASYSKYATCVGSSVASIRARSSRV